MTALRLVVGLGNPGPEYAQTRHNAGFWLVDELARQQGGHFRSEARYHGETCRIALAGQELWLLKPMTYMNRSGQAVAALARFHKIPPPALLVVHDDLDLPPGTVRLKRSGGHGGHNGLRDLIAH
ncbi:MAG: aminoacyl-tRNA hydrolase, partial [Candidatus Competibacteraceae bacterium]|nr:aminoacyl-tRNA hydrolase [Candidatus Competibacteraceae bacterium]